MHVKNFEQLVRASQAVESFMLHHLAALIHDEAYGTNEAKEALDATFSQDGIPEMGLAEILAVRLVRQAADDVCGHLEALAERSS